MFSVCSIVDGNWGGWSSWTSCDCNSNTKIRTRLCNDPAPSCMGTTCSGFSSSTKSCSCELFYSDTIRIKVFYDFWSPRRLKYEV